MLTVGGVDPFFLSDVMLSVLIFEYRLQFGSLLEYIHVHFLLEFIKIGLQSTLYSRHLLSFYLLPLMRSMLSFVLGLFLILNRQLLTVLFRINLIGSIGIMLNKARVLLDVDIL